MNSTPEIRYKVVASTPEVYQEVGELLKGVHVFAVSPRRRIYSVGEIPDEVRAVVEASGAQIVVDRQYDLDAPDTFIDQVLAGVVAQAEIDDWIDDWHNGAGAGQGLHEFLGMSKDEYGLWVERPAALESIISRHRATVS